MYSDVLKSFWDTYSDTFGRTIFHPQYFAKAYAWEAILEAEKKSKGVLLDIGCGRMPYKSRFLQHVTKYIGLDHPETAKMYKGEEKPDIFADATSIPLTSHSIDTIIMFMVLEHLPDPEKALNESRRILKKNGTIILSTVQMYPIHDEPYDYLRYTQFGLKHLFERAGFTSIVVKPQGGFWAFWGLSLNVYLFKKLLGLSKKKYLILLALILAPLFYLISIATNVLLFIPSRIENYQLSRFNISHVVFAKPKRS